MLKLFQDERMKTKIPRIFHQKTQFVKQNTKEFYVEIKENFGKENLNCEAKSNENSKGIFSSTTGRQRSKTNENFHCFFIANCWFFLPFQEYSIKQNFGKENTIPKEFSFDFAS